MATSQAKIDQWEYAGTIHSMVIRCGGKITEVEKLLHLLHQFLDARQKCPVTGRHLHPVNKLIFHLALLFIKMRHNTTHLISLNVG
jgi:hypothetical protein